MIDVDAEFRKAMGMLGYTSNVKTESDKPLTLEVLKEAKRKLDALGPPPARIKLSEHVPAMSDPTRKPLTDDMRQMVEDVGTQKIKVGWHLKTGFGDMVLINPENLKEAE